jgi:hypothetical protein
MKYSPHNILLKGLGTIVLAGGFVWMVGRAPFMPDITNESEAVPASARPEYALQNLVIDPGGLLREPSQPLLNPMNPVTAGLEPAMGLYKARFASSESSPGFATEEYRVQGTCTGAGYRFIRETCPDCRILTDHSTDKMPPMLMWTEAGDGERSIRTVSTDCISVGPDGVPVVGTLRFGEGVADLSGESNHSAVEVVPLLPGSSRVAAVEIGGWLAIFDNVARPSTALPDMATALRNRGWREASGTEPGYNPVFEGERIFTNDQNAFCVVSLSKQGDSYQLLTVVSSHM